MNDCTFEDNKGRADGGSYGWGGAIFLDESDASLIARNCKFINNWAEKGAELSVLKMEAKANFTTVILRVIK